MKKYLLFCIALLCLLACKKGKEEIPVESVTIIQPATEIIEGETIQLTATVKPDDATDKTVEWASSKQSVATITDKGLVTAIAAGSSTITATAGGKTAACRITVSKKVIEVTSVTLNKEALELIEGEEESLTVTVKPDDATDKTVSWSSSAPEIATAENGKITALKEGKAVITAKAGDKEATCEVTVNKRFIPVESVTLDKTAIMLKEDESMVLTATVQPDDATDKTVSWSSSAPEIAAVEDGKITALKEGKAVITAKAGDKEATCEVTVNKRFIPVESVTLDKTTITLKEDESMVLTATVKPDDATDKTITWSSSDTGVVTVSAGRVTSVKEGKATITARAGDKEATCEVIVSKRFIEVTSITLDHTEIALVKGEEKALTATVQPADATDKTLTWASSDETVATVQDGTITALKSGTATVTAMAGDQKASCAVTVTNPVTAISLDQTLLSLDAGEWVTLTATVTPDDADDKTVSWSSTDASIVTVDNNGKVTGVDAGTATITARAGTKSATCWVTVKAPSVTVTKVTYQEAEGEVVNPERGLYNMIEIRKASYSLSSSSVKAKVATGHTLQMLEFYLTDFMDRDVSSDYLDMIQKCFDALRGGGAKAIVRFAYKDHHADGEEMEPEVSQVLSHVAQLKPILQRNEDVLFVLQAGFVGAWGEWYYTTHFVMSPKTDADYAPRKQLTEALLDAVPSSRQIELRTPKFKMKMYKLALSDTLRAATAHSGSPLSRLGGHNDCFGASSSDSGTFEGSDDRKFWKAETRYTIMGGETCKVSDYCLCPQSLKDMEDYHWTYLHDGYNKDVLSRWKTDGCFDEIKARLGYRLVLQEVEYETPRAGQPCTVKIRLQNKGFAAPMNPRPAYLVWKGAGGGTQKTPLGSDPRTWHPGRTEVTASFTPQSGRGTLYLELPDPLLPDNPAYSIALANQGVFDAQTGLNRLFEVQ